MKLTINKIILYSLIRLKKNKKMMSNQSGLGLIRFKKMWMDKLIKLKRLYWINKNKNAILHQINVMNINKILIKFKFSSPLSIICNKMKQISNNNMEEISYKSR